MINLGVIGYGYWGPNLVRNFFALHSCRIKTVADTLDERLAELKRYYPSIHVTKHARNIFKDPSIDAVVIATPVSTHFHLAKEVLAHGKHVLIEKPMTSSLYNAETLLELAEKKKKILMVDHTYLYTDAIQKIKSLIDKKELGKLTYFDSSRTNLGLFQKDINVLWDLAVHDISILLYLIKEKPSTVQASGISHTNNRVENIAFITMKYKSGLIAHLNCSWSSPVKIRLTLIGGTKKMVVYNDVEPTEKVRIYNYGYSLRTGLDKSRFIVDYRIGDIQIPKIELREALSVMAKDFLSAIEKKKTPIANAKLSFEVVKILSLAQESLRNGEKPINYR